MACAGGAEIPDTPDLRALIASYQAPTGSLDATSAAQTLHSAPPLDELSAGFKAATYFMDDVDGASDSSSGSTGSRIRLQGSIGLQVRCPGDLGDPVYDEKVNGSVSLTLAVENTQIRRSFGGEAKACVLQGTLRGVPARIVLDGPLAFDVGKNIGIGSRWSGDFLAQLPGTLTILDHDYRGLTGRLTDGRFQYLVNVDDGTVVLQLGGDGGITILDRTGAWLCRDNEPCTKN